MLQVTFARIQTGIVFSWPVTRCNGEAKRHTTLGVRNVEVLGQLKKNIERVEQARKIAAELLEKLRPVKVESLEPECTRTTFRYYSSPTTAVA